ncbi:hypothetical protein WJX79_008841 [Trebouxia sp. C0005]
MAKGKKKPNKASSLKRGKTAEKPSTAFPSKHDKKTGTNSAAESATLSQAPTSQGLAAAKIVGFTNLGNTCFFNSVLRVLVASPPLQQFYSQPNARLHQGPLGGALQEVFDQVQSDAESSHTDDPASGDKPSKAKKQKQKGAYAPQRLLSAVCKVAPHFKGFQQQDSHELLRVLLDGLQTEEAKAIAAKLKHNSAQQEEVEVSDTVTSPVTPQGFLSEVFGGQLSSRVACGSCDYTSVTLESFMDLSLPIPSASLAKLHTSEPDRRSKKKGKGMRAEDASESISHAAVRTEAQPSDKKLSPKQRRKLERTAMKLERKKQSKGGEAASAPQPASSTSDPASQPCTSSAQSEAQPRRTCAAPASDPDPTQATMGAQGNDTEANDNAQPQIAQRAESADIPAVKEEDATQFQTEVAATEMAAGQNASDAEKEERSGEMAKPLLEGFMGDAVVTTLSDAPQDDADDDTCANIGSLFEEGANEESSAVLVSDYGAAEESDVAEREGRASEDSSLESCLHEFFHQEHISWECPGEKQAKKQLRRSSLGTDGEPPSTPAPGMGSDKADAEHTARRTVSFSEAQPVVTLIPGSVEQRGQVFRTSHGDPPFCRPLRLGGAFVLLTTAPDQRRPTRMQIKIQPQDEEEATLMLASNVRHLATADVPAPKVGDDEEEVRLAQAQVLMDCLADLLAQKGLDGSRAWCEGGLKLKLRSSEEGTAAWVVVGQLPPEEGQGRWEYPSPVDPSQPPSENEAAFASRGSPKKGGLVNVQRPAVKGYSIHRCPPLLTVHVKRFQQDMRGRLSKIDGAVPFPLHLDLTPFCDPKAVDRSAQYTLLGFVEHMGTMRSGHYVAYVQRGLNVSDSPHLQSLLHKHGIGPPPVTDQPSSSSMLASSKGKKKGAAKASLSPKAADPNGRSAATKKGKICTKEDVSQQGKKAWYYISDTQVKPVTEADVLSREAYILLYMRTA